MKFDQVPESMAPKGGPSSGKRSALSRVSSSRRRHGRAVTIEDVMDAEDHLHRISQASTPGMGSAAGEVSPEWYINLAAEPRALIEADGTEAATAPAQVTGEERDAPKKLAPGRPATDETPKAAPNNAPGEGQQGRKTDGAATPAAPTRNPSPMPRAAEQKVDEDTHTSEAGRPPVMRFAENSQPPPHPFQSPMGSWAHPYPHGQAPGPPHYRPVYPPFLLQPPPPLPPMSPPLFGMPHPPMIVPEGQVARLEPRLTSGYELLASRLAGGSESELPVPPIYRRFKDLHHRILLDLHDELCVLEERLQHLDDMEAGNRRYRDRFLPASRRLDESDPSDLTAARKQLKDHISYKMFQYFTQFDMLKKVCKIRDALPEEIHDYRSFLAAHAPVVPQEMRFLDRTGDLMCLADPPYYLDEESVSDHHQPHHPTTPAAPHTPRLLEAPTAPNPMSVGEPMDHAREFTAGARSGSSSGGSNGRGRRPRPAAAAAAAPSQVALRHMMVGICMAVILPILSFPVIPGFVSRMTVVALVGLGLAVVGAQAGAYDMLAGRASPVDGAMALGIYVAFMTVVAVTFG